MMFALYDTTAGADDDGIAHMCGHVFGGSVIQERRRKKGVKAWPARTPCPGRSIIYLASPASFAVIHSDH